MWHLSDMLQWLQQKMAYKVSESDLQLAEVTKQVNLAKLSVFKWFETNGLVS